MPWMGGWVACSMGPKALVLGPGIFLPQPTHHWQKKFMSLQRWERSVLRNWCNSNDPTAVDKDLQMERSADGCSRASDQNRKNLEGGWDCMLHERCCFMTFVSNHVKSLRSLSVSFLFSFCFQDLSSETATFGKCLCSESLTTGPELRPGYLCDLKQAGSLGDAIAIYCNKMQYIVHLYYLLLHRNAVFCWRWRQLYMYVPM
jgi:hypothetical protein